MSSSSTMTQSEPAEEDEVSYFEQRVKENGYQLQVHNDQFTQDGYQLCLFRIAKTFAPDPQTKDERIVILLMHGILESADSWVIQNPAFELAKHDFDVWVGNSRGNKYCLGHETYNYERDKEYW